MLMSVSPTAVQAGKTTECEISSRYDMNGAYRVFVGGDGVTGEVTPPEKPAKPLEKLKVRFTAAPDALLGVRDVRLATPQGASTLGQIVVVRDPIDHCVSGCQTIQTAHPITLPATVCGVLSKPEKVDFYKFTAPAETGLTFHMRCQRLENRIHDLQATADPILTLHGPDGAVLASDDNTFAADPLLVYRFPKAGEYILEVRDASYAGDPYWEYSIEINDRPFVMNVFPSCVAPGSTTRLQLIGHNLPADPTAVLTVPPDAPEGLHWFLLPLAGGERTNAAPVIVSKLPQILEAPGDHATAATAQPIPIPAGVCGRLDKDGEVDCYAFDAKAGEQFTFEIVANRHQSELDSVLRILDAKGAKLAENDDFVECELTHADSRIESWTALAAGRFVVEVRDVNTRGGPRFVYFLEAKRSQPNFLLTIDADKTELAPGTAGAIFSRAYRREGFKGEIQLSVDGLPPGVTATCGKILESGVDGCIILQAAADAPRGAANIRVRGKAGELTADARPLQEYYSPGGGRGHWPVDAHTVSVGDPMDLKAVRVNAPEVTLKPGETKKIDLTIERAPGFNQTVTLSLLMKHLDSVYGNSLPAGVTVDDAASQTQLTGDQTKGVIVLKCAADAKPTAKQLVPALAHVSINFVMKDTYAAPPFYVTVAAP